MVHNSDGLTGQADERRGSKRIMTESMRKKQKEMRRSTNEFYMDTIMEEANPEEMDAEDLAEKALIGNLLIDKYEKEVDDTVSHAASVSSRRYQSVSAAM